MADQKPKREKYQLLSVLATADTSGIRHAQFNDNDHLVVPMVILVEGVLQPAQAPFPELALAEEFARHPDGWNGRPVVIDHPMEDGELVSANSPKILEDESIGMLFNSRLVGKKLKSEAWIDLVRVNELGGETKDNVERLETGEIVEISTGLFMTLEFADGKFEGEEFSGIWRDVVPDHLAILSPGKTGACSVDDGCGAPRVNVRTACGDKRMAKDTPSDTRTSVWNALMDRFRDLMHFRSGAKHELSDVDTRAAIQAALETTTDSFVFIVAVFEDTVVFERGFSGTLTSRGFSISEEGTVTLATEEVQVRPVTEFVPVNVTQEEDMTANTEKVSGLIGSDRTRFTEDHRSWLEGLSDDELETLEPVAATPETPSGEPEKKADENASQTPTPAGEETPQAPAAQEPEKHEPVTPETFLKSAPSDIQEVLQEGLALQASRKKELVSTLVANSRCAFTQEELETHKVSYLENLARLANIPDYSGKAAPRINEDNDDSPPKAPEVFPLKAVS